MKKEENLILGSVAIPSKPSAVPDTASSQLLPSAADDFEEYAIALQDHLTQEKENTLTRLKYINRLRQPSIPTEEKQPANMATLELGQPEYLSAYNTDIATSAIMANEVNLLKQFLSDLKPKRRNELFNSIVSSEFHDTLLHVSLKSMNEECFRLLHISMKKETKRRVSRMKDSQGITVLHLASASSSLLTVQNLLANFSKEERHLMITENSDRMNSCLRAASSNSNSAVMLFYLKKFPSDETLWKAIMSPNKFDTTLGHQLAQTCTKAGSEMFEAVCEVAIRLNRVKDFIFQYNQSTTLLHRLIEGEAETKEDEVYLLKNLKLLLQMADKMAAKQELIWSRTKDEKKATALHRLALYDEKFLKNTVCSYLLSQVEKTQLISYLMARQEDNHNNSLQSATISNNFSLLECLLCHIPFRTRLQCLLDVAQSGSTPLHLAHSKESFKAVLDSVSNPERERLLLATDSTGATPVLDAFLFAKNDIILMLFGEEVLPRKLIFTLTAARNSYGWTFFHICAISGHDKLAVAIFSYLNVIIPSVNLSAFVQHVDRNGNTALHLAALTFLPEVIEAIMSSYLQSCHHRKYLLQKNCDGLVASQMCDMADLAVVRYLKPLQEKEVKLDEILRRRSGEYLKSETQETLRKYEQRCGIRPTPVHDPAVLDNYFERLNDEFVSMDFVDTTSDIEDVEDADDS